MTNVIDLNIKARILYVDDESINLRLFKISFKNNYDVNIVASGEEALELVEAGNIYDIIISDQRMPGLTGTEFMIKAKVKLPEAKYILLTGYTDIDTLEKAINEVGLWQYVKKPWEPSNLKFVIDNAFSSLKTEKQNAAMSKALTDSEERLTLAMAGTNSGVWDWDLSTNKIYLSPIWKQMLGYSPDELENNIKTLEQLLHPDDLQKAFCHFDDYIKGIVKEFEIEYRLKNKSGEFVHILSRGKGINGVNGKIERITGTNIDLTEKYKAQEEIKKLNEELEERVERRTHALKLLNIQLIQRNKFEHLVSKISAELVGIQSKELGVQINKGLNDILQHTSANNCFVLELKPNITEVIYENKKGSDTADILKAFHKKSLKELSLIAEKIFENEPIIIRDVTKIPTQYNSTKQKLVENKIDAFLIVPLRNLSTQYAFGLSFTGISKEWSQEDVNLLKLIGETFINAFERQESEQKLIKRDLELSAANQIIKDNERRVKLLQNIASVANSPLNLHEGLALTHEIIVTQGKGLYGILVNVQKNENGITFQLENSISPSKEEDELLKNYVLSATNPINLICNYIAKTKDASIKSNISICSSNNTPLGKTNFDLTGFPIVVGNELKYIYISLFPANNRLITDTALLAEMGREISFMVERDLTKQELKKSLEKEKQLGELKSQFISMASHQFRTPLTVIQSNVELFQILVNKIDHSLHGKFDKISHRIKDEVARLGELMNDVLLLGKLNADVMKAELKSGDIVKSINEITDKLNQIQNDKRKAIVSIIGAPLDINFDEKLFSHAFTNLLENAFKYSAESAPPQVEVIFSDIVTIKIKDYGLGIPEKEIVNLFQPFYRSSNTQNIEGTGLGLVICKRYLELMNGKLFVKSIENQETTFTIQLPKQ